MTWMRWSLAVGVVSVSWLVNAPAHAVGLVLLSQERYVEASTRYRDTLYFCGEPGEPPCTDSASARASAPDFGDFDVTLAPTCQLLECPDVSASQSSVLGPMGITLDMRAYGEANYGHEGTQSGSSIATSGLAVHFSIDQRIDAEILLSSVERSFSSAGFTYASWSFRGPGIQVDCPVDPECGNSWSFQGTLEPGDYELGAGVYSNAALADYQGSLAYEESIVSLDLRLIPEPGTGLLLMVGMSGIALASRRYA